MPPPTGVAADSSMQISILPSTSVSYLITSGVGGPVLQYFFNFDTALYSGADMAAKAIKDATEYAKFNDRISTRAEILCQAALGNSELIPASLHRLDARELLSAFIDPIRYFLSLAAQGNFQTKTIAYTRSIAIGAAELLAAEAIGKLTVQLKINDILIPNETFILKGDKNFLEIEVPPLQHDNNDQSPSLHTFASATEQAINECMDGSTLLKVASSEIMPSLQSAVPQIWIIRFNASPGSGIGFAFSTQSAEYYAPALLSGKHQSFELEVNQYNRGKVYPDGPAITTQFTSVDLDDWANTFLQSLDNFSDKYADAAFALTSLSLFPADPDYVKAISGIKSNIIQGISKNIIPVIEPGTIEGLQEAQDYWHGLLNNKLSFAYSTAASVHIPAAITGTANKQHVSGAGILHALSNEDDYALSASQIGGTETHHLSFAVFMDSEPRHKTANFINAVFMPESLSFHIADDQNDGGASKRNLTIIIRDNMPSGILQDMGSLGNISVPAPLRQLPPPVILNSQEAIYNEQRITVSEPIADVRHWSFAADYVTPQSSYDLVNFEVECNLPAETLTGRTNTHLASLPMYHALAQFRSSYLKIEKDLDEYLIGITPENGSDKSEAATNARMALLAFSQLSALVADSWPDRPYGETFRDKTKTGYGQAAPGQVKFAYEITEKEDPETKVLLVTITPTDKEATTQGARIDIPGYESIATDMNTLSYQRTNSDGETEALLYRDRKTVMSRNFILKNLDIMKIQNARGSAYSIRNLNLMQDSHSSWIKTNPLFVRSSSLLAFRNKYKPTLEPAAAIDLATVASEKIASGSRTLQAHLRALLEMLTQDISSGISQFEISLNCNYSYELPDSGIPVSLPIMLIPNLSINVAERGEILAGVITSGISNWIENYNPQEDSGHFSMMFTIFSAIDPGHPILKLPVNLKLSDIIKQ